MSKLSNSYRKRTIEDAVGRYIKSFPAVGLTGPRQSGKSTMLKKQFPHYKYVTFDNPTNIESFENDPNGFMTGYSTNTIFDEVQHVPKLFQYIKIAIDKNRHQYGNFILTGSSQFHLLSMITESLAGRIGLLSLLPFQYIEMPDKKDALEPIFKGSYPELVIRDYRESEIWFSSYIDTYLNKDVRSLSNIRNLLDFQRFMRLLAANVSQVLDMSTYARDLGVSVPTISRWISVLEASYIVFLVPPFYNNLSKRVVKRPKLYFYDNGLVSFLTGIKTWEQYDMGPMAGALFENYIVSEILKKQKHTVSNANLYFLRTSDKSEIDLIVDSGHEKELIEIKKSSSFNEKMIQPIKRFITNTDKGFLLYNGETLPQRDNIRIINYKEYLA